MKSFLKITIAFFILLGCEKMDQPDLSNRCLIKSTVFDSSNEILGWEISYYKNGNNVKHESSFGVISETKYDNKGNKICYCSGNERTEYKYNLHNKVIKETSYIDNQMDHYISFIYKDTLVDKTYRINSTNDTIYFSSHYYNSANKIDSVISTQGNSYYYYNSVHKIDSVISHKNNWYYYYSAEADSTIITNKERLIEMKFIKKYENGRMIYYEYRMYDRQGNLMGYQIATSDYNDEGLLTRRTEVYYHYMIYTTPVTSYTKYYHEESVLLKTETFDGNDILQTYTMFENTCK